VSSVSVLLLYVSTVCVYCVCLCVCVYCFVSTVYLRSTPEYTGVYTMVGRVSLQCVLSTLCVSALLLVSTGYVYTVISAVRVYCVCVYRVGIYSDDSVCYSVCYSVCLQIVSTACVYCVCLPRLCLLRVSTVCVYCARVPNVCVYARACLLCVSTVRVSLLRVSTVYVYWRVCLLFCLLCTSTYCVYYGCLLCLSTVCAVYP
jgi:hypothetical protein